MVALEGPRAPSGLLLLGHGAGGGVDVQDLVAARDAALDAGWAVGRVTQPYRVAGRRAPAPAAALDEAWLAVVRRLRGRRALRAVPLVVGGRSSGARVACRTAGPATAVAVVGFAFPLRPPRRPGSDRSAELAGAGCPVHLVQGERDPFGGPSDISALRLAHVRVTGVSGADHALRTAAARRAVRTVVGDVVASVRRS